MLHVALAQAGPTPAAEALARVLRDMGEASWEIWSVDSSRQGVEPAGTQLILADISAPAVDPTSFLALLRRLGGPPLLGALLRPVSRPARPMSEDPRCHPGPVRDHVGIV